MSSLSISSDTKDDFNDLQPSGTTQDEFVAELLEVYRTFNGEPVDHERLAEELSKTLIPQTEIAAYRGTREYHERSE